MTEAPVVRHHVVVPGTPERAFEAFTQRLGEFKPPEHNLLGSPIASTVLEPRIGGHIVDSGEDGSECRWATGAGLRAAGPAGLQLGHRPDLAARGP